MPIFTTTAKWALRRLTGANPGFDIDAGFTALADDLDPLLTPYTTGTLAARPPSTPGSPGKAGRWYRATDTLQLFYDYGTGWYTVLQSAHADQNLGPNPSIENAGEVNLIFRDTAAGTDRKRTRFRTVGGVSTWESVNDAFTAILKVFIAIDHTDGIVRMPWGAVVGNGVQETTLLIPGEMKAFAGAAAPTGWLFCNGQAISRATYPQLFGAIGTQHGGGDGSTTFNVPDARGRSLIGVDTTSGGPARTLGTKAGEVDHLLTTAETPSHTHTGPSHTHTGPSHTHGVNGLGRASVQAFDGVEAGVNVLVDNAAASGATTVGTEAAGTGSTSAAGTGATGSTGGGAQHNNMPPFLVVNWIIKA